MNAPDAHLRLTAAPPDADVLAPDQDLDGVDANQRLLAAELAWLAAVLREPQDPAAQPAPDGASAAAEHLQTLRDALSTSSPALACSALDELSRRFGLSPFERSVLLLAAAPELDSTWATTAPRSSFGMALARLPGAHWSAVAPAAPLRAWRLVVPEGLAAGPLMSARLAVDEAVLHRLSGLAALAGPGGLDARLAPWLQEQPPRDNMDAAQRDTAEQLALQLLQTNPPRAVLVLHGDDSPGQQDVAAWLAARLGRRLFRLATIDLPAEVDALQALAERWRREARWLDLALLIQWPEPGTSGELHEHSAAADAGADDSVSLMAPRVARFLAQLEGLVVVAAHQPLAEIAATQRVPVQRPRPVARRGLWHQALQRHGLAASDEGDAQAQHREVDALAAQFPLSAAQIDAVANEVANEITENRVEPNDPPPQEVSVPADTTMDRLWQACRRRARRSFGALARCTEPAASWDDLVLPEGHMQHLRHIVAQVRLSLQVHEDWGFAPPGGAAPGVTALFWGDSGTGKTLACEVLAHELRLDLVRVDLAGVISKYIGETEKNLRRIFDAAEDAGALLLFDEADALFGQRSEVRDSHDRYANQEVAWLLQRMESHRGLAVLTTNQREALDAAFLRRLRFVLPFPFPDAAQRERLWRRMVPARAPRDALDFSQLARLPLAGGAIRNAALNAAFLAADEGQALAMRHFAQAARHEAAKDERALPEGLLRAWEGGVR